MSISMSKAYSVKSDLDLRRRRGDQLRPRNYSFLLIIQFFFPLVIKSIIVQNPERKSKIFGREQVHSRCFTTKLQTTGSFRSCILAVI